MAVGKARAKTATLSTVPRGESLLKNLATLVSVGVTSADSFRV
jgi:hypothetical protein